LSLHFFQEAVHTEFPFCSRQRTYDKTGFIPFSELSKYMGDKVNLVLQGSSANVDKKKATAMMQEFFGVLNIESALFSGSSSHGISLL